jgi:hypothetical protein
MYLQNVTRTERSRAVEAQAYALARSLGVRRGSHL